jgi:hypothetical protein
MLAIFIVALILGLPIYQETQIRIKISGDIIQDVSVSTPRVPLISLILKPSHGFGAYTINVSIVQTGEEFSIQNVPSGEYIVVWKSGIPPAGIYTIKVELFKNALLIDDFTLNISF